MPGWLQVFSQAACSCPSSLSKFGGGTWTSGSARGKHVIKFVQVPCPSSCPSSGSSPGGESLIFSSSGCLVIKKRSAPPAWAHADNNKAASSCPSSLSKFGGGTWTSGFARGKHVIKFVQVPCPSSCPSSGSPNFSEFAVFSAFCTKKRSGDEAVTSLVTSVFWTKFGCFGAFWDQKSNSWGVSTSCSSMRPSRLARRPVWRSMVQP